ncbi:hypothetical protein VTG60DRAFT_1345 [Thermothelomyces hinnuleus]
MPSAGTTHAAASHATRWKKPHGKTAPARILHRVSNFPTRTDYTVSYSSGVSLLHSINGTRPAQGSPGRQPTNHWRSSNVLQVANIPSVEYCAVRYPEDGVADRLKRADVAHANRSRGGGSSTALMGRARFETPPKLRSACKEVSCFSFVILVFAPLLIFCLSTWGTSE